VSAARRRAHSPGASLAAASSAKHAAVRCSCAARSARRRHTAVRAGLASTARRATPALACVPPVLLCSSPPATRLHALVGPRCACARDAGGANTQARWCVTSGAIPKLCWGVSRGCHEHLGSGMGVVGCQHSGVRVVRPRTTPHLCLGWLAAQRATVRSVRVTLCSASREHSTNRNTHRVPASVSVGCAGHAGASPNPCTTAAVLQQTRESDHSASSRHH
jgi:hypothetical protein